MCDEVQRRKQLHWFLPQHLICTDTCLFELKPCEWQEAAFLCVHRESALTYTLIMFMWHVVSLHPDWTFDLYRYCMQSVVPLATASCGLTVTPLLPSMTKEEVTEAELEYSGTGCLIKTTR